MPPARSPLMADGRPHKVLLWLLSASGELSNTNTTGTGDVPVLLFRTA